MLTNRVLPALVCIALAACSAVPSKPVPPAVPDEREPLGLLILDNETLEVAPEDLDYTGRGTYVWPSGRRQTGDWLNGRLHGDGTDEHEGARYEGAWEQGQRHGQGRYTDERGNSYVGGWNEDARAGFGQGRFSDGSVYDGEWLADRRHGFGTYTIPGGESYRGGWIDGKREGYGRADLPNGVIYEGMWQNGERHGYGEETRPDKSTFAGQWAGGMREGEGTERFGDGGEHAGSWQEGRILGPGTRRSRAGIEFSGAWIQNVITTGLVTFPDGLQYAGPIFEDRGRTLHERFERWLAAQTSPHAHFFLGAAYIDYNAGAGDIATARVWLARAAAAGVAEAQYRLALLDRETDPIASLQLLEQAAAQGHGGAAAMLGEYYHIGHHVVQHLPTAVRFYQQAVQRGSLMAMNNLAWLLATTVSELADPRSAVDLIQPLVLYLGDWQHLDTLAAAHARLGNTDLAHDLQEQALQRARREAQESLSNLADVVAEMEGRLATYASEQAYTE